MKTKKAASPYEVRGRLSVAKSATVILVRRRGETWESLMAESEVINWMKSSLDKLVPMRYGGEWKLVGGNLDEGETPLEAAKRELEEEMLSETNMPALPADAVLRPLCVRQTRAVRSRSNLIYFFIGLETENKWLEDLDIEEANTGLAGRRERFKDIFLSGEYEKLPHSKKESISPEIHSLRWMPIDEAVDRCLTSTNPGTWASDFQRREYEIWNVKRLRDPMYLTGIVLRELKSSDTSQELLKRIEQAGPLEDQAKQAQWLFDGMSDAETQDAMKNEDVKIKERQEKQSKL